MYQGFKSFLWTFIVILCSVQFGHAQHKRAYKRAMRFYEAKNYKSALPEFEKSLEGRKNINVLSKMAYCYRMNNDMAHAFTIYDTIIHHKRIRPKAYFYYAETLINQNRYEDAKGWFQKYVEAVPKDSAALLMVNNCDLLKDIKPLFPRIQIKPFAFNSDADDSDAVFWNNHLYFSSDRKIPAKFMKETSGWTGREYLYVYSSKLQEDSIYLKPKFENKSFNFINKNNSSISFRRDSSEVYLCRNSIKENKAGMQGLSIFRAFAKQNSGTWQKMKALNFCKPDFNYFHPSLSPNGQFLYFTSDKRRGEGGTDIWYAKRVGDKWSKPINMGEVINTPYNEGFPYALTDDILIFCSKGHAGYGGFDLFYSIKDKEGQWGPPRNMGKPINSAYDEVSFKVNDIYTKASLTTSRDGGDDDIFMIDLPLGLIQILRWNYKK